MNGLLMKGWWCATAFALLIFLSLALNCSKTTTTGPVNLKTATVALRISWEKSPQLDPIFSLLLTVSAEDMDTIRKPVEIQNDSFEVSLDVPVGNWERLFTLEAKNAAGKTLYSGSASTMVEVGRTCDLNIDLVPAVLMIRITPRYVNVSPGQEFACSVEVCNVTSFFGASFRIEFDQNALEYLDARISNPCLLGPSDSVIFFDTSGMGYAAVSVTRTYPYATVSGSGPLARLAFRANLVGTTQLTFDPATLRLIDDNGEDIPDFDSLIIDEGTVEISQQSPARSDFRPPLFLDKKISYSINCAPSSRGVAIETLENGRQL